MYDIISIGPAGIDVIVGIHDANLHCSINKDDCHLELRYADKIMADSMNIKTAHDGMNNAVGVSRLGLKTAIYTVIGADHNGRLIFDTLKKEKIDTRFVKIEKNRHSDSSVVINFKGERTILSYHDKHNYKLPKLAPTKMIYLASIGYNYLPFYNSVAKYVQKNKILLALNPGTRQLKDGPAKLKSILRVTDILFVNREEARILTKIKKEKNEMDLLRGLRSLGVGIAVMTDSTRGSYLFDGQNAYHQASLPAKVLERTGCGDAYASGFLAALNHKASLVEAMKWGTINAAYVVQKIGAQDGLLTLSSLLRIVKENPNLRPKSI